MEPKDYDWDAQFSRATYDEIRNSSPDLSNRRYPTLYSPDRKLIYLSSLDDAIETDDTECLKKTLSELRKRYHSYPSRRHRELYLTELDFTEISLLLFNLEGDEDGYANPRRLLDSVE